MKMADVRRHRVYETVGGAIQRRRMLMGLTPAVLASRANTTPRAIHGIEDGSATCALPMLYAIAGVLGCAPGDLTPPVKA